MRNKKYDRGVLQRFLEALENFQHFKSEKWEKIDDAVQASILPGTPTEDWIIPPDEKVTAKKLMEDPLYRKLHHEIDSRRKEVLQIAHFLKFPSHALEWISFKNPLVGNAALDEAIIALKELIHRQESAFYPFETIKRWLSL